MAKISIEGIGVVGGFGCGIKQLSMSLADQKASIEKVPFETTEGTARIPAYLADTSSLEEFVPKRALRRIDHFSKMALLGAYLALQDAGMPDLANRRVGLVVCSGYGATRSTFSFLDSIIDDGDTYASPTLFSNSVHNAASGHISILLKLSGPSLTVSQFEMSVPVALLSACQWMTEGRVDSILFGGVDEYCDVLGYCWQQFFGEDLQEEMRPLAVDRQSAVPGEGSAFFLLSHDKAPSPKYGFITDVHVGNARNEPISFPEGNPLILGVDKHEHCGAHYARFLRPETEVSSYASLYGSLPIGPAFDMAIAALSIKEGRAFASTGILSDDAPFRVLNETRRLGPDPICCLKFGREGDFGIITLSQK